MTVFVKGLNSLISHTKPIHTSYYVWAFRTNFPCVRHLKLINSQVETWDTSFGIVSVPKNSKYRK